jgi:hypothetical protein
MYHHDPSTDCTARRPRRREFDPSGLLARFGGVFVKRAQLRSAPFGHSAPAGASCEL